MKTVVIFIDDFHQVSKQSEVHVFPSEGAALIFAGEFADRNKVLIKVPDAWWHIDE